jgi:hypothetical protein
MSPLFQTKPVIEVHLIGISEADHAQWSQYSMSRYWQPNDALRRSANKKVMSFGSGRPDVHVLTADDPIWKQWLSAGATRLYVLAFLPRHFDDAPGALDPRRRILPLDQCRWKRKRNQTIRLTLLPTEVRVDTKPLAGKGG